MIEIVFEVRTFYLRRLQASKSSKMNQQEDVVNEERAHGSECIEVIDIP